MVTLAPLDVAFVCFLWALTSIVIGVLSYSFGTTRQSEYFERNKEMWRDWYIGQTKDLSDKLCRIRKVLDGKD